MPKHPKMNEAQGKELRHLSGLSVQGFSIVLGAYLI